MTTDPQPITVKRLCYVCGGSLTGCFNCVKGYTSETRPMNEMELAAWLLEEAANE